MLRLLQIEWLKVKNYRTFWILLAMTIVSIPGWSYLIISLMNNKFPKSNGKSFLGSPFAFPDAWQTVSYNSAPFLFIIPAILVITLTTNEFTFKTHRQNVIDGWSRGQFVSVKLFELLLLSIVCTVIVFLTTLVFGTMLNKVPDGVSIWSGCRFVFFYFIQAISYFMIAFLMALLIKRAGLAMAAFLGYLIGEQIIVGVTINLLHSDAANYLPEEVTDSLIPQPYGKKMLTTPDQINQWEHHIPIYLVVALVYLILYVVISRRRFTTSDL